MISKERREQFAKEVREYFIDYLYKHESDLEQWASEMDELQHIFGHIYATGVMDGLAAVPGLQGRQVINIYEELTGESSDSLQDEGTEDDAKPAH